MSEHNLAVLRGCVSSDAQTRELATGQVVVQFDLTVRDSAGTSSVPVAWYDPPGTGPALEPGADLVVVGAVHRRFFRAGGSTQSRTEVVAERVVPHGRRRDVTKALAAARALLE